MSQKSTPRSPKSPRSKSPSCEDIDGQPGEILDELQRAVEEELRSSDRVLTEARNSIAGSKGRSAQSRASYQQSPSKHSSRIPSPRAASTCEEEGSPRLPSPPVSPVTYGSRAATPGISERGSRVPSPEYSGTKTHSAGSRFQNVDPQEEYCSDDPDVIESSYPSPPRGTPTSRSTAPNSKVGSVTFGNKQSGVSYASQGRYGNEMATSVAGLNAGIDVNTSALRMNPSKADAATSCLKVGQSGTSSCAHTPASRVASSCPQSATSRMGSCPQTPTPRTGSSCPQSATSRMGSCPQTPSSRVGSSCPQSTASRMGSSYVDSTASRMGAPLMESGVSIMGMGSTEGSSALTYVVPKDQPPKFSAGACSPGCRKFMKEIDEFKPLTSTPIKSAQQYSGQGQSMPGYDKPSSPCPQAGGRKPCSSAPVANQQMAQAEFAHHDHHSHQGHQAPPKYERSPSPPSARFPQPGSEYHQHHFVEGPERTSGRDEKVVSVLSHLSQLKKTPSYYRCGLNQGTDFLKVCCPKGKDGTKTTPAKFPEIPCLREEELDDLIKCEIQDVDSAWYIMSDERKTYKKPCPKQQKAQMTVKALMQAHAGQTCSQKEYSPLEHPDPEDLSPELAAAMMFSQERGLKMEECPNDTITSLFPDEPKTPFPEKIPASSISIVDRSSKDQEEMIEKSASVPSEGVSDSAYTRTMKGKGEEIGAQKSFDVDFAIGQSKREYILVAQKPQRVNKVQYRGNTPPWFPGFLSAFPDDDGLKIVNSPSGLFHKAWVHSNPGNMPTSDVIVLD